MTTQIVKTPMMTMFIQRNLVLAMLTLLALTGLALNGAAYAQVPGGTQSMLKEKDEADNKAAEQYINRMETDEKYRETLKNQQLPPASNDPWGTVRPITTPAKPAVKSASGASKAPVKPATAPAASANSTAQKAQ